MGGRLGISAVHHVTLLAVSEKHLRLTLIPSDHLKFLHRCHGPTAFRSLGHLSDIVVLSATVGEGHVARTALQIDSLNTASQRSSLLFGWHS